ncbi:hypothetical protein [Microbacterium sulfonylureivorans]|uniref:hypothetical protein n=1 Tax=Microbacterium sulfonylureivorans TaxID=2486854 RepID=UPI000FDA2828|nr:hypothetical protein [Microbacterium sulfonylureivorans]
MKSAHRTRLLALGAAVTVALVGCGPAPWTAEPSGSPSTSGTAVPTPVPNDLSSGATQRELVAGAVTATVDYWSTLSMDKWTADAVKPVSLNMTTVVSPADGQKVYLQKATMTAVPSSATGTLPALEPQVDSSTVSPGYLVLSPYSYSQTFNVGPLPEETVSVTLQFAYDFLVQTTPTSKEYAKQTATDSLTIAVVD